MADENEVRKGRERREEIKKERRRVKGERGGR